MMTLAKYLQTMISKKLFYHSKPVGSMIRDMLGFFMCPPPFDIKGVIWQPLCFQNKAKITLRQAFLA